MTRLAPTYVCDWCGRQWNETDDSPPVAMVSSTLDYTEPMLHICLKCIPLSQQLVKAFYRMGSV